VIITSCWWERGREKAVATLNASHIQSKREDRSSSHPWILLHNCRRLQILPVGYSDFILSLWQIYCLFFFQSPPFFFLLILPPPLLIPEHHLLLASPQACLGNFFYPTPSHTTSSIAPKTVFGRLPPSPLFVVVVVPAASLGSGGTPFGQSTLGTATWGARSRSENGPPSVFRRPAEPVGIGVVGARLRLFPSLPVRSGPVRDGSVRCSAGTARGAPTAAPVERDGGRLAQDHTRLVSGYFTCGAAARLPFLPQWLPDADRLELLRWDAFFVVLIMGRVAATLLALCFVSSRWKVSIQDLQESKLSSQTIHIVCLGLVLAPWGCRLLGGLLVDAHFNPLRGLEVGSGASSSQRVTWRWAQGSMISIQTQSGISNTEDDFNEK